jgi:hypothetical protein
MSVIRLSLWYRIERSWSISSRQKDYLVIYNSITIYEKFEKRKL